MEITKTLYDLLHDEIHELNNLPLDITESSVSIVHNLILHKTDRVAGYLNHLDDQLDLIKSKISKLKELENAVANRNARFRDYIAECIKLNDGPIKGNNSVLSLITNPHSVEITDPDKLDLRFTEIRQEVVIKKKEILEHFKATGEIPRGTNIVQKKRVKIGGKI